METSRHWDEGLEDENQTFDGMRVEVCGPRIRKYKNSDSDFAVHAFASKAGLKETSSAFFKNSESCFQPFRIPRKSAENSLQIVFVLDADQLRVRFFEFAENLATLVNQCRILLLQSLRNQ